MTRKCLATDDKLLAYLVGRSRSLARRVAGVVPAPLEVLIPLSAGELSALNDRSRRCEECRPYRDEDDEEFFP
ncbi:MAG TPA: hypothetical protein VJZ71_20795 [Phycisphaerae bacterium]|nr:hypothetical protein [Phycisphaerae bacterium]